MINDAIQYTLDHIGKALGEIEESQVEPVLNAFFDVNKVFVYGVGRSGLAARAFAMRLTHLGFRCYVIGETITPPVEATDLVLLVSGSGATTSVVRTAQIARSIGSKVVCITSNPESELARLATAFVVIETYDNDQKSTLAPLGTLFEDGVQLFLDGVIVELMTRMGETEARMSSRHATLE